MKVPPNIELMIRLANLIPHHLRVSGGMHELLMRQQTNELLKEQRPDASRGEEAIIESFYLRRYIRELPTPLQAFVLQEFHFRYVEMTPEVSGPSSETPSAQLYRNLGLLEKSDRALGDIIAHSNRRFEFEIDLIRNRPESRGKTTKSDVRLSQRRPRRLRRSQPVWPPSYSIRGVDYRQAGLVTLVRRAKERFFFIFAVEELLDAMVEFDIENKLNETLYDHEAGMSRGSLFIDDTGRIQHIPSPLFSLVENTEVNRVRRCQVCVNYFWAGRTDKIVCGDRCGATLRKRIQRKNDLAIKRGNCVRKSSKGNS